MDLIKIALNNDIDLLLEFETLAYRKLYYLGAYQVEETELSKLERIKVFNFIKIPDMVLWMQFSALIPCKVNHWYH